jgi:molecular chaperone GrpE
MNTEHQPGHGPDAADEPGRAPAAADDSPAQQQHADQPSATSGGDLDALQEALAAAEQRSGEAQDAMMRMQAEMENLRKRLARDLERSRKRALEAVMADLLPVRDSLERGLQAASGEASVETLREGNELIIRMFSKVLADHGLVEVNPQGETFNPELHEAISLLPSPEHPRDTVIDVVQKGFLLNDYLVRPARVVVSSGPPQA